MHPDEKQHKKILFLSLLGAGILIITMLYQSREILFDNEIEMEDEVYVGILTSDQIIDQSWGSLAYKGQLEIEGKFPVKTKLKSDLNSTVLMKEATIDLIEDGARLIIGHGREFSETFTEIALTHPHITFVTIHGSSTYHNQAVYTFNQGEIDYFAALAATLKSKTQKIAIIDAIDEREIFPQFEKGINHYAPKAQLFYEVVNSRNDGDKAVEIMEDLIASGVDVVYSKGNAFNQDVIDYAKKEDIYVIGYMEDQSYMAKDHVLTSVLNNVSNAYIAILRDFFSEEGISPGTTILNETDEVYGLAPLGTMFSKEEKKYVYREMEKFKQGEFVF
ncbi:BMP family ABC transporter substrate-binding protein [Salipaludibacillus sp. HK11]|uniref:BMP family ABC transporter substrate-binding protein n=1 Tax=Salipaludibacillus sp. HK11 TaxID=3394320 RepID=UPI0039FDCB75